MPRTIDTDQLARLVVARITKDHASGDGFLDESACKVHRAALRSLAHNLALEVSPHDERLFRLFGELYNTLGEV